MRKKVIHLEIKEIEQYVPNTERVSCPCKDKKSKWLCAKGIMMKPFDCIRDRSVCASCSRETNQRYKRTTLECELIISIQLDKTIQPLIDYLYAPWSLEDMQKHLKFLPTIAKGASMDI